MAVLLLRLGALVGAVSFWIALTALIGWAVLLGMGIAALLLIGWGVRGNR